MGGDSCVAYGCNTNYATSTEKVAVFHFPKQEENPDLYEKWVKFVNRGNNWEPKSRSVLCSKHFEEKYIKVGKCRSHMQWKMQPIPTIHSSEALKRPSAVQTPVVSRKRPKIRVYQDDELQRFRDQDIISGFDDLDENRCPPGYEFKKMDDSVIYYKLEFDAVSSFPKVFGSIRIDKDLHVQLQCNGNPLPLPLWFIRGTDAKLRNYSQLENFPNDIKNAVDNGHYSLIDELEKRRNFKPKGRPPYSSAMIRYALLLRYTSLQAYKLLLQEFPMPSISLLNKLQAGGVDAIKSIKYLLEKKEISRDIILMFDEMYLQKSTQFHGGKYEGADEDDNPYKGMVVFMIAGMKKSIPYVIKACPETAISGKWIAEEIEKAISLLSKAGFNIRGIVADNHSSNVSAFNVLLKKFDSDSSQLFIRHPENESRTYLFFDNVHLLKNIRNNLFNAKKIVFPKFEFKIKNEVVASSPDGYITWADLHSVYDKDSNLPSNLKKAYKLSYRALHPGNNKQNVDLALALFHETTVAAVKSYLPERQDMSGFLELISTWWTIVNSRTRYTSHYLANAVEEGDGKTEFLRKFADWLEIWSESPAFSLTAQTSKALIRTLRAQAELIDELLSSDDYSYVIPRKLQSDPLEKRFSQYRQMSGGRFLVSLVEVNNSERILACRSLLKEGVDFWSEDLSPVVDSNKICELSSFIEEDDSYLHEACLTSDGEEVATTVAGYIAKKLTERSNCNDCKTKLVSPKESEFKNPYFNLLSRGSLTVPSPSLADFVVHSFAVLDAVDEKIMKFPTIPTRNAAEFVLKKYSTAVRFTCDLHCEWGSKFSIKSIVNVFFNNKQKICSDLVRKDAITGFKKRQREKPN